MFVLIEVAFSFGIHDHIWLVTWPEHKNRINSQLTSSLKPTTTDRVHREAKSVAWTCSNSRYCKSYHVIKFLWRHSFFNNRNFKKSMLQILHLNVFYPLAFVSLEKDVNCVRLYGFCVLITWLTKYGHDYRKWREPPLEKTWPKTNPRILRGLKIWRLDGHP